MPGRISYERCFQKHSLLNLMFPGDRGQATQRLQAALQAQPSLYGLKLASITSVLVATRNSIQCYLLPLPAAIDLELDTCQEGIRGHVERLAVVPECTIRDRRASANQTKALACVVHDQDATRSRREHSSVACD